MEAETAGGSTLTARLEVGRGKEPYMVGLVGWCLVTSCAISAIEENALDLEEAKSCGGGG